MLLFGPCDLVNRVVLANGRYAIYPEPTGGSYLDQHWRMLVLKGYLTVTHLSRYTHLRFR